MKNTLKFTTAILLVGFTLYACGNRSNRTSSTTKESTKETSKGQSSQSISGSGTKTQFVNLNEGLAIFEISYSGTGHFAVWLKTTDGENFNLLANEIGGWNGSKSVKILDGGKYIIDVESEGKWNISIN